MERHTHTTLSQAISHRLTGGPISKMKGNEYEVQQNSSKCKPADLQSTGSDSALHIAALAKVLVTGEKKFPQTIKGDPVRSDLWSPTISQ